MNRAALGVALLSFTVSIGGRAVAAPATPTAAFVGIPGIADSAPLDASRELVGSPQEIVAERSARRDEVELRPKARVDHHVHLLGPGLLRDWKSIGVSFSRPDTVYGSAEAVLGAAGPIASTEGAFDRAVLVPMAHLYGAEEFRAELGLRLEEERLRVAAENDFVAREARRHPGRAVAFCSVAALRPYALEELERCRRELGSPGIKLHFGSSGVDLRDAGHMQVVSRIADWAQRWRLPILLHFDPQRRGTEIEHVRRFASSVLGSRPNLTTIVAHLGGSGGYGAWTRAVFAALHGGSTGKVAGVEPRPSLYFDLSAVLLEEASEGVPATTREEAAALRDDLRAFGLDRILFGSDFPVFDAAEAARRLERFAGLRHDEVEAILRNSPPGLFDARPAAGN